MERSDGPFEVIEQWETMHTGFSFQEIWLFQPHSTLETKALMWRIPLKTLEFEVKSFRRRGGRCRSMSLRTSKESPRTSRESPHARGS